MRIIKYILILMLIISFSGCKKTKSALIENEENSSQNEKESGFALALKNDKYYKINNINNSKLNMDLFNGISIQIFSPIDGGYLVIKKDGSLFKYNVNKLYSNNSNILISNFKINKDIIEGFGDSDGIFWLFDIEKRIYKFDFKNEVFEKVNDIKTGWIFRSEEFSRAINKIEFERLFIRNHDDYVVLKDGELFQFKYLMIVGGETDEFGVLNNNVSPFEERFKLDYNKNFTDEYIEILTYDFIRTSKGLYRYTSINESESIKYADIQQKYEYVKMNLSTYTNKIVYINGNILVDIEGNVYSYGSEY